MIKIVILVFIAEILTAVGQILFKKTTNNLGSHSFRRVDAHFRFLREVLTKPAIWTGFFSMALGLVVWLIALAQSDLSIVFPLGSMQYIMILFLAHFFLGEKIDKMKLAGTILVVLGIVFITMS